MADLKPSRIRTLIVDDEPLARMSLATLCSRDTEIEVIGQAASGIEAVEAIRSLKPDLLFLDIQMPGCDGFEVLERLGAALPQAIVFVTAYDHYALKAFEAQALDYLLKPFTDSRFERVLERAKSLIRERGPAQSRIAVKSMGRITFVKSATIDWIEAADYYACLHVGDKTYLIRRSIADLNGELDANSFCRIHRSTIVNLNRVAELSLDSNGDSEVVLDDGTRLRLSRSYREQLKLRLKGVR
jgi:two-component system, LytTR family, response regulator